MPIRLGPPPKATLSAVHQSMQSNKAKNTCPEIILQTALRKNKLSGLRLNYKLLPGRPDICYIHKKLAIFINGCFWHRCHYCKLNLPKTNKTFWSNKFKRNKERDRLKNKRLKKLGWKTMTIWECQIRKNINGVLERIRNRLI